MADKVLIPLYGNDVAPRFDLATDILITQFLDGKEKEKIIVLPHSSSEELCHLIITENINTVICGGIEEEYYQYLVWKKINIMDSVIGSWKSVIKAFRTNELSSGSIVK